MFEFIHLMNYIHVYIPSILESLFFPLDYSYILNYHWWVNGWCFNQPMGTLELTRTVVTGVGFASRSVGGAQMLILETLQGKKLKWSKKVSEISKIKQNPIGSNFVHAIWALFVWNLLMHPISCQSCSKESHRSATSQKRRFKSFSRSEMPSEKCFVFLVF